MDALSWPHLLIIFAVIVLLFGAAKLPGVAKALGQSVRVFKNEMAQSKAENAAPAPTAAPAAAPADARASEPGAVAPAVTENPVAPRS